jgi:protein SCO1/2
VRRGLLLVGAAAVACAVVFSSSPLRRLVGIGPTPPVLGEAPNFSLVGDDGKPFSSESLRGRPWLASFLFTSCPGPCPKLVAKLKALRERVPASRLVFVSFSVDPGTDTPEVLAAYKRKHGIGEDAGWTFLTGPEGEVTRLVQQGFLTGVERTGPSSGADGGITHGLRVALVDSRGHLRGFYATEDDEGLQRLESELSAID